MTKKKIIYLLLIAILLIGAFIAFNLYQKIYGSNTSKKGFVYLKTNANFDDLREVLSPFVKNINSFNTVAELKKFTKPKAGKYLIKKGLSNNELVNMLRNGNQIPVKLAFNNQHTLANLAGRISQQIEADSISLLNAFTDKNFLSKIKFTQAESLGLYIPNSYQINWNTSAEKFRDKMYKEYQKFWNNSRLAKAKKLNLSSKEVMTVASIVQKETAKIK